MNIANTCIGGLPLFLEPSAIRFADDDCRFDEGEKCVAGLFWPMAFLIAIAALWCNAASRLGRKT